MAESRNSGARRGGRCQATAGKQSRNNMHAAHRYAKTGNNRHDAMFSIRSVPTLHNGGQRRATESRKVTLTFDMEVGESPLLEDATQKQLVRTYPTEDLVCTVGI